MIKYYLNYIHISILKKKYQKYLISVGVKYDRKTIRIEGKPILKNHKNSEIHLGSNVSLLSNSIYNIAGINHPVILATCAENAIIKIGNNTGLSGTTIVCVDKVEIGDNVNIGVNACIYDNDFHPINFFERRKNPGFDLSKISYNSIVIGNDVWIGANSTILKGVKLGNRVVVAAGSVVTKSFPADSLIGGNPAKLIRIINQ
jgi:acetyltransferase-like isoleucine patch superfamily enzyme